MSSIPPFHLAIPVDDLELCRIFYRDILNCKEGRHSKQWVDFNFYGHQLVIHYKPKLANEDLHTNPVDGKNVPIPHFGVVLEWDTFYKLASQLKKNNIQFIIEPYIRFQDQVGEQATMFFKDPSGNAIEFKAFKDIDQLFSN